MPRFQIVFCYAPCRLVLYATEQGPGGELARQFSQRLWKEVLSGHCKQWVGTHAEKVLAAVLHADPAIRKAAQAELAPLIKPKSVDEWIGQFVGKDHHLRSGDVKKEKAKAVPSPVQQQQQTPKQHQGKAVTPAPAAAKTPGKGVTPAKPVKQKQQQTPEGKASGGKRPAAQPAVSAGKHHATPKSANKAKN